MAFYNGFSGYMAGSWQTAVQFTVYDQLKRNYLGSPTTNATSNSGSSGADAATVGSNGRRGVPPRCPRQSALGAGHLPGGDGPGGAAVHEQRALRPAVHLDPGEQEGVVGLYKGGAPLLTLALVVYWMRIVYVSACLCVLCERVIITPIVAGVCECVCVRAVCVPP